MDNFLTAKSRTRKKSDIPIIIFCVPIILGQISRLSETLEEGVESIVLAIFTMAPFVAPIAAFVNRWVWVSRARQIAIALDGISAETVTLSALERAVPMHGLKKRLRHLIQKEYLRNVKLDPITDTLILNNVRHDIARDIYYTIECSGCGARSKVRIGHVERCEYCGQMLEESSNEITLE